jgi:hypothetical protein
LGALGHQRALASVDVSAAEERCKQKSSFLGIKDEAWIKGQCKGVIKEKALEAIKDTEKGLGMMQESD